MLELEGFYTWESCVGDCEIVTSTWSMTARLKGVDHIFLRHLATKLYARMSIEYIYMVLDNSRNRCNEL